MIGITFDLFYEALKSYAGKENYNNSVRLIKDISNILKSHDSIKYDWINYLYEFDDFISRYKLEREFIFSNNGVAVRYFNVDDNCDFTINLDVDSNIFNEEEYKDSNNMFEILVSYDNYSNNLAGSFLEEFMSDYMPFSVELNTVHDIHQETIELLTSIFEDGTYRDNRPVMYRTLNISDSSNEETNLFNFS